MIYVVSKFTLGDNAECFVIQFFIFMGISYGVKWGRKCEAAGQDWDSSYLFQMGCYTNYTKIMSSSIKFLSCRSWAAQLV